MANAGNSTSRLLRSNRLYTLTEVAETINVSMPTAHRYKRIYQTRIPSFGSGRQQRYPREALKVFEEIKIENLQRRGRPPKKSKQRAATKTTKRKASNRRAPSAKRTARVRSNSRNDAARKTSAKRQDRSRTSSASKKQQTLLTLTEISRRTGISYPTCISYVKKHSDEIPHVGSGRQRRFPSEAVMVFRELRRQSRPGRRKSVPSVAAPDKAMRKRIRDLERGQRQLVKQVEALLERLDEPLVVTIKRS